ncbi:hypothetical protein LEP1GSC124_0614 [Leptospira interrogans serovar Pyrogenes str. 200701872]|uniref:Uncharacterized protein n=1 Tax=Leptospira interrogans serovar Pyrogenes str. 200701872 TaxID=1193029 RepID=M7A5K4_LEPIR|nr:hypothetical protein LEP1GSC124_0614 [Leptospira interrogans serovar Pyrogenes str. 200701872]
MTRAESLVRLLVASRIRPISFPEFMLDYFVFKIFSTNRSAWKVRKTVF